MKIEMKETDLIEECSDCFIGGECVIAGMLYQDFEEFSWIFIDKKIGCKMKKILKKHLKSYMRVGETVQERRKRGAE